MRQFAAAERLLEQAAANATNALPWQFLGAARHALGKRAGAIDAFERALQLDPALSDAACALAMVLAEEQRWPQAEAVLQEALRSAPEAPQVHFNLAVLLERRSAEREALDHYDCAIRAAGHHADALLNRGALKMRLGRPEEALENFDQLIRHNARAVDAHVNRNRALLLLQRDEDALEAAETALKLAPRRDDARLGKAIALASLGRLEEARAVMQPVDPAWNPVSMYVARALERQDECDWRDRDRLVEVLRSQLSTPERAASVAAIGLLHRALALPLGAEELLCAATATVRTLRAPGLGPFAAPPARQRIRLAFLSAGVSSHPDYYLLTPVLQLLDRSRFEVLLYAFNSGDGSVQREEMIRAADAFVDVSALDAASIASRLRADAPDVAIDTGGFFVATRPEALKSRVAPVQVAYLGIPASYGAELVDYRISDPMATPAGSEAQWGEKLALVPAPHFAWRYGGEVASAGIREDHALPERGTVYCCFNQSWKIEPEAFAAWMRVLNGVADSVLWLLDGGERIRRNLCRAAQARGVDPDRLVFGARVPFAQHVGRLAQADVFLDTFHYNAVTTALDTLWAGVPVVTREGTTMASRLGATFVRSAGLSALVATGTDEYERIALRLGTDKAFLASAKAKARAARTGALFEVPARVCDLERAITAMVQRRRSGGEPQAMDLSSP
jgi:predicted O-linked N-acetylglucosamine transferase (SPINDLY family)